MNLPLLMAWVLILVPLMGACGSGSGAVQNGSAGTRKALPGKAVGAQPSKWVDFYDPNVSEGGYNLILYGRRRPMLMDMNGAIVHAWPDVRAAGRAKLLPTGHLAVIDTRGHFDEYDWEGQRVWSFRPAHAFHHLHHDFTRLRNGDYLLLVRRPHSGTDYLLEVNHSGAEVWRWESREFLQGDFGRARKFAGKSDQAFASRYKTHMNSVQELPPNRWFDAGHEQFRPGNILVSVRNLSALYIVARPSGKIVWRYYDNLDYQHEARMVPAGLPGAGDIMLFNNGYHGMERYRQSAIIELDPVDRSVVWTYRSPNFFSSIEGTEQVLPRGNVLVTSSRGGRAFELTREGQIVWQWTPRYLPMRVSRYPYDFCPQLAALSRPSERPVRRRDPERFIDADLYSYALPNDLVRTGGTPTRILRGNGGCRRLRLPEDAELTVGYGVSLRGDCRAMKLRPVQFGVSIWPSGAEAPVNLLQRRVQASSFDSADEEALVSSHRERFSLASYARKTVELCLTLTSLSGGPPPPCFRWEAPEISPGGRSLLGHIDDEKDPEALKLEREELKALGYVN